MPTPRDLSRRHLLLTGATALLAGCAVRPSAEPAVPGSSPTSAAAGPTASPTGSTGPATASHTPSPTPSPTPSGTALAERATVPVLCYHQIRDWTKDDSSYSKQVLICPPANFRRQLDGLAEAGYTTISPDDYLAHLRGGSLPDNPVIISFDDGKDSQPLVAGPELVRRGMVGTFFVMTVVIGKSGWITPKQIKGLADAGHTIGSHTWDHHQVTKYSGDDWRIQFDEARATLRKHSGQAVETFAYPYGAWNPAALPHLAEAGYTTAFQLGEKPVDPGAPALTLRRVLVNSTWSGDAIVKAVRQAP